MKSEKVLLNPERLRIIQFLILHKQSTASDILKANNDITRTTLYRHLNLLEQHGFISIAKETKIRGTVEKTYILNRDSMANLKAGDVINQMLLGIMGDFGRYIGSHKDDDFVKDMLLCQTSSIHMTDEEYTDFLTKLGELVASVINNEQTDERKLRRLTFISSPT